MDAELIHLQRMATHAEREQHGVWTFHQMTVSGRPIVALRTGMGLINAAAGAEILLDRYFPAVVLNFGCSGAHLRDLMPGDVVIGERVVHHSAMTVRRDGSEVYKGFGYEVAGERMDAAELPADPGLLHLAREVTAGIPLEPWPLELDWPAGEPHRTPQVHVGAIASADIWTQWTERLELLHDRHGSLCEDMEAAAIGQIAALHGVPFLAIKDISNNEFHKLSDLDEFSDFPVGEIGRRAAAVVAALIPRIGELA
jgi:adenosylhomocysteine nucleosidase